MGKLDKSGYYVVSVGGEQRYLHREVYYKAYPKHNRSYHVHHIDHCKTNNNIENLIALPAEIHKIIRIKAKAKGSYLTRNEIESLLPYLYKSLKYQKKKVDTNNHLGRKLNKAEVKELIASFLKTNNSFESYNLSDLRPRQLLRLKNRYKKIKAHKKKQEAQKEPAPKENKDIKQILGNLYKEKPPMLYDFKKQRKQTLKTSKLP